MEQREFVQLYHPQSNGMIERFIDTVEMHGNIEWTESLPAVLLGLRTTIKSYIQACIAQLVYGTTFRLSSILLTADVYKPSPNPTYVSMICKIM